MARRDTLYVTDMDGTLLGADSRVSETSREIISRLSREGYYITVATARTPATVVPLLEGTRLNLPAIVFTGAALWTRPTIEGRYEDVKFLSSESTQDIKAIFDECEVVPMIYTLPEGRRVIEVYRDSPEPLNHSEEEFVEERRYLPLKRFHLHSPLPQEVASRVILFFALGPKEGIEIVARRVAQTIPCYISFYNDNLRPDVAMLEIFAPGVSKAKAVEEMAERLGVKRIVVFGDNLNDLPMFEVATESIAVENALEEVKAKASQVIPANIYSSVARFIEED